MLTIYCLKYSNLEWPVNGFFRGLTPKNVFLIYISFIYFS